MTKPQILEKIAHKESSVKGVFPDEWILDLERLAEFLEKYIAHPLMKIERNGDIKIINN